MRKIDFHQIQFEVIDSWQDNLVTDNNLVIYSKKIGESFCILSLYKYNKKEYSLNKLYNSTLKQYKQKKNYKEISKSKTTKNKGSRYRQREIEFQDEDSNKLFYCKELFIEIEEHIYIFSGVTPDAPLTHTYKKLLQALFNSIRFKRDLKENKKLEMINS